MLFYLLLVKIRYLDYYFYGDFSEIFLFIIKGFTFNIMIYQISMKGLKPYEQASFDLFYYYYYLFYLLLIRLFEENSYSRNELYFKFF